MDFSKILLSCLLANSIAVVSCAEPVPNVELIDQQFGYVLDALKMLPTTEQYLDKMQDDIKMYENVFVPLNEEEKSQRIKNAKEKTISFYANIFGVDLLEIEKYDVNFTDAQYLTWVAKEVINNASYRFAKNEQDLFDISNTWHSGELQPTDFGTQGTADFPELHKVPELWGFYCSYNNPHFESYIVHETGHVLDYAYRILKGIRSKTKDQENELLCDESVSVFFETLYAVKRAPIFMKERLTDWYGIKFMQSYIYQLRKQKPNTELETKTIKRYDKGGAKRVTAEEFLRNIANTHPEVKFIYEIYEQQVKDWNITKLPVKIISCAGIIAFYVPELLDLYSTGTQNEKLKIDAVDSYVRYVPHVYRTLKISQNISTSKDVIRELDKIVTNVPTLMTKNEVKEFMELLDEI